MALALAFALGVIAVIFWQMTMKVTVTNTTGVQVLTSASIEVASTSDFDESGKFAVKSHLRKNVVAYTSKDATHFLGCTGGKGNTKANARVSARDESKISRDYVISVATIAAASDTALLLANLGGDWTSYTIFTLLLLGGSCFMLFLLWKFDGARYPSVNFTIGVALTALLGLVNFLYTDIYSPYTNREGVSLDAHVDKALLSSSTSSGTLPITLTFRNSSGSPVYVLGTSYSVVGRLTHLSNLPLSSAQTQAELALGEGYDSGVQIDGFCLLAAGQYVPSGSTVNAGQSTTTTRNVTLQLPLPYDEIIVYTAAITMRADRASLSGFASSAESSWDRPYPQAPKWVRSGSSPGVMFQQHQGSLTEASKLQAILRTPRQVKVWWVLANSSLKDPGGPYLKALISTKSQLNQETAPSSNESGTEGARYGLTKTSTGPFEFSVISLGLSNSNQ
ncbi:MAG: hypothetical protein ABSC30_16290 [Acidimicrobiales bacterium]